MSDTEPTDDSPGAVRGPSPEEYDPIELFDQQRHRNGDETAVLLCEFGGGYQAIAFDVDAGGQLLETEVIGDAEEYDTAKGMIKYWLQQNPDGVLGGSTENGGWLARLFGGG